MKQKQLNKTASYWGKEAGTLRIGGGIHWTEHQAVQERLNKLSSGNRKKDVYQYFIDLLRSEGIQIPLDRCLTLGCGAGDLERGLSKHNFCKIHDASDIAEGAIIRAKEQAQSENLSHIRYEVADINNLTLQSNCYDVVFGIQSIHHITELEHVFAEVDKSLKPGGYFFLNEFIGPTQFQWTDYQLDCINAILKILPKKYRINKQDSSKIKDNVVRQTVKELESIDPSEAIRSAEILPLLNEFFTIKEKIDLGGTILHLLLQDIAGNFDYNNPDDIKMLEMLFIIEDTLMETGELQSDFAVIIAQKK